VNSNTIDDKLDVIFKLQEKLMQRYKMSGIANIPDWPVDIQIKKNQQACRDAGLKCVEELFEAVAHLKNWKPHRQTIVTEFDRDAFLEEVVDSLHYLFELLIFVGVDADELTNAYIAKNTKNHKRLDQGY